MRLRTYVSIYDIWIHPCYLWDLPVICYSYTPPGHNDPDRVFKVARVAVFMPNCTTFKHTNSTQMLFYEFSQRPRWEPYHFDSYKGKQVLLAAMPHMIYIDIYFHQHLNKQFLFFPCGYYFFLGGGGQHICNICSSPIVLIWNV